MSYKGITGTFLDEITYDIASSNWGEEEWHREFDTFVEAGLDTVIVIRAGLGERLACPSKTISRHVRTLPVYQDLVGLFLQLASERGIRLLLGLYDSGYFWYRHDWRREVEINAEFIRELLDRYGDSPAFGGWYLPHETPDTSLRILEIHTALAEAIREVSQLPILISPYFLARAEYAQPGAGRRGAPLSVEEHARQWEEIFSHLSGLVTYCAFQDGTADLLVLEDYVRATRELADRFGIELWSNAETFDRDVPIKFPPIDWRKLAYKLDVVQPYVEKIITFEFSHFLSPNSIWPSARLLYRRYRDLLRDRSAAHG